MLDAFEGGLPSARHLGAIADAAEAAGAPTDYVTALRSRECRSTGSDPRRSPAILTRDHGAVTTIFGPLVHSTMIARGDGPECRRTVATIGSQPAVDVDRGEVQQPSSRARSSQLCRSRSSCELLPRHVRLQPVELRAESLLAPPGVEPVTATAGDHLDLQLGGR